MTISSELFNCVNYDSELPVIVTFALSELLEKKSEFIQ